MDPLTTSSESPFITIHFPKEFQYAINLAYLARSPLECMFHLEDDKVIKAVKIGNRDVLLEVSSENSSELQVRFLGRDQLPPKELCEEAVRYVREWFDLNTDIKPFYKMAEGYPLLDSLVHRFYGLRIMGIPDLFESLCWGIMGQQINLPFAYLLKKRFVETYGRFMEWEGRQLWIFPDPKDIATLTVEQLMPLQLTRNKSEYILEIARRMAEGRLSKDDLLQWDDFKLAEKELTSIRGIGPWTANYAMMRCLRDPSAFLIADVGLHNAVRHLLELDRKPTLEELRLLFAEWGNWAGYITFYMWRTLY
jgi:DNA-3-methyladenine glycosylase II